MAYQVLKQFQPNSATVWVEKLSENDTVDIFDTQAEAAAKIQELETIDNTRKYKVVEV